MIKRGWEYKGQAFWRPICAMKAKKIKKLNHKPNLVGFLVTNLIHLRIFFKILQFFWPSWYILAFKRLVFCTPILIWSKSSIKRSYGWYKSRIRHIDVCLCKLVFQATRVAFLAFLVLKLKSIEISEWTTSNKPKNAKKL